MSIFQLVILKTSQDIIDGVEDELVGAGHDLGFGDDVWRRGRCGSLNT